MIIAIIILLFASFFFSISETALTAVNRLKLQTEAEEGNKKSKNITKLLTKPRRMITTILIGKNISNVLLITLVTILTLKSDTNIIWATIITILAVLLLIEVLPRALAETYPYTISRLVYWPLTIFIIIFSPLTLVVHGFTNAMKNVLPNAQKDEQRFSKEEIRQIVTIAESEGAFNKIEHNRIQGVMDFEKYKITDVDTTPRINVTAFPSDISYEEAYDTVTSNPFTRYPVYGEDIDDIIGVFHSKYLLTWSRNQSDTIMNYISEPLFVNEHNKAEWVLRKMTVTRKHLAIVLDEYGGTDAIVSHEDLIEEMLGMEIEDEMDKEEEYKLRQQMKSHSQR
ncbi:CNNM domain-containing protein [Staphylococcus sp. Marseille-Q5304]|uniref:hemolysin family protein n=1 Tax=Staphylococcus sp. Marseille-Q5304 TaxID=2942200 RepID=UPI0020732CDA|nr:CNNM domain-containing protein [Staphylococcus sp. Marseille-Q5304]